MTPAETLHTLLVENPRGLWTWELAEILEVEEQKVSRIICKARQLCEQGETIAAHPHTYRIGSIAARVTKYKICPDWIHQRRSQRELFEERKTA